MPFPVTPRYFLNFRNSDTGLTPTFVFFKEAVSPFNNVAPPAIVERSNGMYFFDWSWATKTDVDIIFEVDGGASIPTEEVRYIKGTISPRDRYLDEPVSQVVADVWADNVAYAAGQKGKRVDDIGAAADNSATASLFGKTLLYKENVRGDSAGGSDGNSVKQVYDRVGAPVAASIAADIANVRGADNRDLTQLAGTGTFVPATDNLHEIASAAPSAGVVASAVWDEVIADPSHTTANSAAVIVKAKALEATAQAIKTKTDNLPADTNTLLTTMATNLVRALGLMHENSVLDNTIFDGDNNLTAARFRLYDTKANAQAAGATGLIATYTITATYTGGNLDTYTVVKEP